MSPDARNLIFIFAKMVFPNRTDEEIHRAIKTVEDAQARERDAAITRIIFPEGEHNA